MISNSRHDRKTGFPFSRGAFSERAVADRPWQRDLSELHINDSLIPEGQATDGNVVGHPSLRRQVVANHRMTGMLNASHRFAVTRSRIGIRGFRLLPLASFAWGSRDNHSRPRTNPDHVLLWITAGELRLDFPRRQHVLPQGSIQFIPAGTAFAALPLRAEGVALLLAPSILPESEPSFPSQALAGSVGESATALSALFTEIEAEAARHDPDIPALHRSLHGIAQHLARLEPVRKSDTRGAPTGDEQNSLVERFLLAATGHLQNGRTVAEIAAELGTNTGSLDRACRSTYGKRAIEMMNDLRLQQAIEMLGNCNIGAARIAQKLGYTSLAHFTRAFVSATGHNPETYRRQSG